MMKQQKQWKDLATATKIRMMIMGVIQVALLVAALWDIRQRPAEGIKGDKKVWVGIAFINFVGPLAYVFFGRKQLTAPPVTQVTTE